MVWSEATDPKGRPLDVFFCGGRLGFATLTCFYYQSAFEYNVWPIGCFSLIVDVCVVFHSGWSMMCWGIRLPTAPFML